MELLLTLVIQLWVPNHMLRRRSLLYHLHSSMDIFTLENTIYEGLERLQQRNI